MLSSCSSTDEDSTVVRDSYSGKIISVNNYVDARQCATDVTAATQKFNSLRPFKRECVVDGHLYDMINLEGTLQIVYKGDTYNIPLRVMLLEDYPRSAPLVYIQPTETMKIARNIDYLDDRGKVSIGYLNNWRNENHPDVVKLLFQLSFLFSENPPVWTKKTGSIVKDTNMRTYEKKLRNPEENNAVTRSLEKENAQKVKGSSNSKHNFKFRSSSDGELRNDADTTQRHGMGRFFSYVEACSSLGEFVPDPTETPKFDEINKRIMADADKEIKYMLPKTKENSADKKARNNEYKGLPKPTKTNQSVSPSAVENDIKSNNGKMDEQLRFQETSQSASNGLSAGESNILKTYSRKKLIGSGGFAKVYLYEKHTKDKVACKIVDLGTNDDSVQKHAKALKREINLLSSLNHNFIVKYFAVEEYNNELAMIMEYFRKGSLYQVLQETPENRFSEDDTRVFTWQILQGLKYLHENQVIHRDIKGRNILVGDQDIIKIADFGISKKIENLVTQTASSSFDGLGSIFWQSPEALCPKSKCGRKTDIWSLGCTVVEMLRGKPPLCLDKMPTLEQACLKITMCQVYPPDDCSDDAKQFLQMCFKRENERPSSKDLMSMTEFPRMSGA